MFEENPAALIDVMAAAARAESAEIARRLGAVAGLYRRRCRDYEEAQFWFTDVFEAVGAEVSAAQNISRERAIHQVRQAVSLWSGCRRWRRCSPGATSTIGWCRSS